MNIGKNVGKTDKLIRLVAGAVLIAIAFLMLGGLSSTSGLIAAIAGVVLIGTGVFNVCLAYRLFGINTRTE